MKLYVKKVDGLVLPVRGTERSTGYDIIATSDPKIVGQPYSEGDGGTGHGGEWLSIQYIQYETNLFVAPESQTHDIKIYPRSSVRKYNLNLANCVPIIDNDYRGMIYLCFNYLWQPGDYKIVNNNLVGIVNMSAIYKKGDAIGQMALNQVIPIEFAVVDDLSMTQRGEGGFGSTDLKHIAPKTEAARLTGETLIDKYLNVGGIPIKERYSDEMKKRNEA